MPELSRNDKVTGVRVVELRESSYGFEEAQMRDDYEAHLRRKLWSEFTENLRVGFQLDFKDASAWKFSSKRPVLSFAILGLIDEIRPFPFEKPDITPLLSTPASAWLGPQVRNLRLYYLLLHRQHQLCEVGDFCEENAVPGNLAGPDGTVRMIRAEMDQSRHPANPWREDSEIASTSVAIRNTVTTFTHRSFRIRDRIFSMWERTE